MRNQDNWQLYYEKTSKNPARKTLITALDSFHKEGIVGHAFDLGCGACNDVSYLLNQGWEVSAVDNEIQAQIFFEKKIGSHPKAHFQLTSFEEIQWKRAHLIHAGFALAFCPIEHFKKVIHDIQSNLSPGGRFAGNFFGPEHTWQHLSLVSKEEIETLFKDFNIEWIEESKQMKTSTLGEKLFHHNINLIAKKTS